MSEAEARAGELLRAFFRLRNHKFATKPPDGIRPGEMLLLAELEGQEREAKVPGQGLTISELGAIFGTSPSSVTQHVNPLEQAGYLVRRPDDKDRRVVRVCLTAAGREKMRNTQKKMLEEACRLAAFLGPEDTDHFIRILYRIKAYTDRLHEAEKAKGS